MPQRIFSLLFPFQVLIFFFCTNLFRIQNKHLLQSSTKIAIYDINISYFCEHSWTNPVYITTWERDFCWAVKLLSSLFSFAVVLSPPEKERGGAGIFIVQYNGLFKVKYTLVPWTIKSDFIPWYFYFVNFSPLELLIHLMEKQVRRHCMSWRVTREKLLFLSFNKFYSLHSFLVFFK